VSNFVTILPQPTPLDRAEVHRLARHGCLDIHRVEWIRAYLALDGSRLLCWFKAHDAESVRLVLRHQGWPGAMVWPVEIAASDEAVAVAGCAARTVVELAPQPGDENDVTAAARDYTNALRGVGLELARSFASTDGTRPTLVVATDDESAVAASLELAQVAAAAAWACVEFDPSPPDLFEPGASAEARPARGAQSVSPPPNVDFDAVIIGAGISGICAAHRLLAMGLDIRLYESASDVGGVWHWNRYPGARVDSETYTYGFSFSDELVDEWDWPELFSAQPEIRAYLQHVVDRFDLRRHMRFDTRVETATYDDDCCCWVLRTDSGASVTAQFLIAATGTMSTPQLPEYHGMDEFSGASFHTARWPADGIDLRNKRVGVVGTGASGVQVIQTIAADVDRLFVFQRTPTYCVPQRNRPLSETERAQIRRDWPGILASCRESYGGFIHAFDSRSGLAVSASEREAKFEALWQIPGFAFWFGNFADVMMNIEVNEHASDFVRRKIRERVTDPEVARQLMPDHPFGTKRVPLENGYYEVYNRDNVELVDIRATPIERVTDRGIRTSVDEYPLDTIVWATGFDAGTGPLTQITVCGERGVDLRDKWRDGPRTFLGLLVSGFPNFFIVNGPQNAAGLCNAGRCIEQNVDWIARCIAHVRGLGRTGIVPSADAEARWTEHVSDVAAGTVLKHMTESWFFGANTPGKARCVNIYAAGAREYRGHCEAVASAGYSGCSIF
jgi:acetone monooxygenase